MNSMHVFVAGHDTPSLSRFQQRLGAIGIRCTPLTIGSEEQAQETLTAHLPSNVILFHCDPAKGDDVHAISALRKSSTADIIAVGNATDSRHVVRIIRAGATDYVHDADEFANDVIDTLHRIRARNAEARRGRVISFVGAGGGCGVSSMATNIAASLTKSGQKTGLLDLNVSGGDLSTMLNLQPQHTLIALSKQAAALDEEMFAKATSEHASGIHLLASPPPLESAESVLPGDIAHIIECARRIFPNVIIDLEDVFHQEQLAVLQASEKVVLVFRLELPSLVRVQRIIAFLKTQGVEGDRLHLAVNRYGQKNELSPKQVAGAFGHGISFYIPEDYATAVHAINVGNPVVTEAPFSKLAAAYIKMAHELAPVGQEANV